MTDRAREVVNALLGLDRDVYKPQGSHCVNGGVCKYMLASFCPFMMLQGTRRSIGRCKYTNHEEYYRMEYIRNGSVGLEVYEWDFTRLLVEIVLAVQKSLSRPQEPSAGNLDLLDKIDRQEELFSRQLELVGSCGVAGDVEEAFCAMKECEKIKKELERTKEAYYVRNNGLGMERCEVCGASITPSDTDRKLDKHLSGRLHKGHVLVRRKLAELLKKFGVSSVEEIFPEGVSFEYIKNGIY